MEKQYYQFRKMSSTDIATSTSEHFYVCPEDAMWHDVMRQFAVFLDTCGYVGVYENVDLMLEDYWNHKSSREAFEE